MTETDLYFDFDDLDEELEDEPEGFDGASETNDGTQKPSSKYEGMNAYSDESFGFSGPLESDTVAGVDPNELLTSHGMILKYSDERYEELYNALCVYISENHEMSEELFNDIFYGKITAITKNCYNSFKCSFACESILDLFQEAYMLIYTKSIPCFFLRPDDGEEKSKDKVAYLRWCKTCIMNRIKSKLRGKKKIDLVQLRFDTSGDDEEETDMLERLPSRELTPEETVIFRSRINDVYRYVAETDVKPEKKLLWCMISTLILTSSVPDRIEANHYILENYASMTLTELAVELFSMIDRITWLDLNAGERELLCKGMDDTDGDEVHGLKTVSELIGADGTENGEKLFLKRLSDWVYKLNEKINSNEILNDNYIGSMSL